MATRYSGTLIIKVSYSDKSESYTAHIGEANDDARIATQRGIKLAPIHNRLAADSAEAYDLAAKAALGFASAEGDAVYMFADCDAETMEFNVSRKRAR